MLQKYIMAEHEKGPQLLLDETELSSEDAGKVYQVKKVCIKGSNWFEIS